MEQIWQDRNKLSIELVKIPEAIKRVQTSLAQGVSAPIVLADYADNPGGGGYGDPARRDPALVAEDVRLGRYSAAEARALFGYEG